MSPELQEATLVVSAVLPFRVNKYVLDELIDWDRVPDDPIYRLVFPHRDMLPPSDYNALRDLIFSKSASKDQVESKITQLRMGMNPHPAGQMTHNIPMFEGNPIDGVQHKYRETALFFPAAGQSCHAYCTFCFRWPQFVNLDDHKFQAKEAATFARYLREHYEISDVLFTGGDPMIMNAASLQTYIEPILSEDLAHIENIRIGTKSVAYWPARFVTDRDAGDLLRLFERVKKSGRQLAVMGHYSHPRELETPLAREAMRRILSTGAVVRMQSPVIKRVNDDPNVWSAMWKIGVKLGAIPYYMFVERDTGPKQYFSLPLIDTYHLFRQAYSAVSGLARTVRGPSMSTTAGKVCIEGVATIGPNHETVYVLQYLQHRDPTLVRLPFFAKFDPNATWINDLKPARPCDEKFFAGQSSNDRLISIAIDNGAPTSTGAEIEEGVA